ncbi:hypothetical protein ACLBOM_27580 [Escherichia coli]
MNPERSERIEIPVLPLRDVVVYPHGHPLICRAGKIYPFVGVVINHDKKIMLVAQKKLQRMSGRKRFFHRRDRGLYIADAETA